MRVITYTCHIGIVGRETHKVINGYTINVHWTNGYLNFSITITKKWSRRKMRLKFAHIKPHKCRHVIILNPSNLESKKNIQAVKGCTAVARLISETRTHNKPTIPPNTGSWDKKIQRRKANGMRFKQCNNS